MDGSNKWRGFFNDGVPLEFLFNISLPTAVEAEDSAESQMLGMDLRMVIRMHSNGPPFSIRMFECHSWVSEIGTLNAFLVSNVLVPHHECPGIVDHSWLRNAFECIPRNA